jgi:ferredoxin--NADP+ reductase
MMGSPYTSDLLYDDLFRKLESEHSNFHYHTAISRESPKYDCRGIYVDRLLDMKMDEAFGQLLSSPRTLVYICGIAGMQIGLFRAMAKYGVHQSYVTLKDDLAGVDPAEWTTEQIKRSIRPTRRCMLEVYD